MLKTALLVLAGVVCVLIVLTAVAAVFSIVHFIVEVVILFALGYLAWHLFLRHRESERRQ